MIDLMIPDDMEVENNNDSDATNKRRFVMGRTWHCFTKYSKAIMYLMILLQMTMRTGGSSDDESNDPTDPNNDEIYDPTDDSNNDEYF